MTPKRYKVIWTQTAADDLNSIIKYIQQRNPQQSIQILHRIQKQVSQLIFATNSGRIVPELNQFNIISYRELIENPLRIIYKSSGQKVIILAVIDSRRNVEDILLDRFLRDT